MTLFLFTFSHPQLLVKIRDWITYDLENRKKYAVPFLSKLRLGLIEEDKVKDILGTDLLHQQLPELKAFLGELMVLRKEYAKGNHDKMLLPEAFLPRNYIKVFSPFLGTMLNVSTRNI